MIFLQSLSGVSMTALYKLALILLIRIDQFIWAAALEKARVLRHFSQPNNLHHECLKCKVLVLWQIRLVSRDSTGEARPEIR